VHLKEELTLFNALDGNERDVTNRYPDTDFCVGSHLKVYHMEFFVAPSQAILRN
jgi:hypothetical protein